MLIHKMTKDKMRFIIMIQIRLEFFYLHMCRLPDDKPDIIRTMIESHWSRSLVEDRVCSLPNYLWIQLVIKLILWPTILFLLKFLTEWGKKLNYVCHAIVHFDGGDVHQWSLAPGLLQNVP